MQETHAVAALQNKPNGPRGGRGDIPADWLADFEAAARRPLAQRMRYSFIKTYKPVMDDAGFRSFSTMREYREW
jgi:hypothetical protein